MIEFNHFAELAEALLPAVQTAVQDTATDVQAHVRSQIASNGQVDTGHMLNSVYVSGPKGSTYAGGGADLPEEKPEDDTSAVVGVAAYYGVYQELGTRFMPPR